MENEKKEEKKFTVYIQATSDKIKLVGEDKEGNTVQWDEMTQPQKFKVVELIAGVFDAAVMHYTEEYKEEKKDDKKEEKKSLSAFEKKLCDDLLINEGIFDYLNDMFNKFDRVTDKKLRRTLLIQELVKFMAAVRAQADARFKRYIFRKYGKAARSAAVEM